ncbi:short-chain fatty acyl-CoA regulator family protein [Cupriavidus sp. AU9028]|uniref:short-chain fatty acyl-CoA regulator family protein n=1 Tax=Cupriavidus sp. AU9028 TaxID=2871157 RepID=UPI001C9604AA|nr:short-chain fatty acyl-CoA regulator family protein [Cupriavidus sp. AU9028]MBY4895582.1 short-chain fatty acyl-CoA regulator family protein [Cupriavidus sp. AU9028]
MAKSRKIFVGARVRRLREQRELSQLALAGRLSLSLSYVSQIENNQRPVTAAVLLKLAEVFGGDVGQFSEDQDQRHLAELDAALKDRTVWAGSVPPATLQRMIEQAPDLVEAFLSLYTRYGRLQDEYAQAIDRLYADGAGTGAGGAPRGIGFSQPHEEVRDHFNRQNNYLDTLDVLAEQLAGSKGLLPGARSEPLRRLLLGGFGISVTEASGADGWLRRYDPGRRQIELRVGLTDAQRAFQLATQLALLMHRDVIDAEIRAAGFTDPPTQELARQGLAHYFAGAVLLPYRSFLDAATRLRYDIELLQQQFQVSIETVCHRLSTLQRPNARGVPFYFVRLDQAGNISKRQSATSFHFARHGGACPLWHVHEAFAQPGRILAQVAEMPDGIRYFGIARTIERGGGGFRARRKLFAIGLGCELAHARDLVYADHIDVDHPSNVVPIGPGCRVCPRQDCVQRAFPPAGKEILIDSNAESLVSYRFGRE